MRRQAAEMANVIEVEMLDTDPFSKEQRQLLETNGKVSRSLAVFQTSLEEKCMKYAFRNATRLSETTRQQFTRLSPVLRSDFLKKLESWTDYTYHQWNSRQIEKVFWLVQLLLDNNIKEFDFGVYGESNFEKDEATWQLLVEKCPNLTRLEDKRKRKRRVYPRLSDILPHLLQLRSLEHIKINLYTCSEHSLEQLLDAFPNLRSLAFAFNYLDINQRVLEKLFRLQNLQVLWIGMTGLWGKPYQDSNLYLRDKWLDKCVKRLPLLQEVDIVDLEHQHSAHHNEGLVQPDRLLALTTLRVKESFNGWSTAILPRVNKLHLEGPLRDVNEFVGFKSLTAISFVNVSGVDMMQVVKSSQATLREMVIKNDRHPHGVADLEPSELFSLCKNLQKIDWVDSMSWERGPKLSSVGAEHFKNLKSVHLNTLGWFPSNLMMEIFKVPGLEKLKVSEMNFDVGQIEDLCMRLQNREILQRLKDFKVSRFGTDEGKRELHVSFLKILVAYTPRLQLVRLNLWGIWSSELKKFFEKLQIPDLLFLIK